MAQVPSTEADLHISVGDVVQNNVLQAGPELNEVPHNQLSSLERFFVDVANVYLFQQKEKRESEEAQTEGSNSLPDLAADVVKIPVVSGVQRAVETLGKAQFQVANIATIAEQVLRGATFHTQLAMHSARLHAPLCVVPLPQRLREETGAVLVKKKQLNMMYDVLSAGTVKLQAAVQLDNQFTNDLLQLSRFWHLVPTEARARVSGVSVVLSQGGRRGYIVPLTRGRTGHAVIADPNIPPASSWQETSAQLRTMQRAALTTPSHRQRHDKP